MTSLQRGVWESGLSTRQVHRWTREEYHRIAEAGVFDGKRVELIEGEVIEMAPMLSAHATGIVKLNEKLFEVLAGKRVVVRVQCPIVLGDFSEPEPDLALVAGTADDYALRHPGVADLLLLVEVSDTTLADDRNSKLQLYAAHGVEEYWIVNIPDRRVEVFRHPEGGLQSDQPFRFLFSSVTPEGGVVSPAFAPDLKISVSEILPPSTT